MGSGSQWLPPLVVLALCCAGMLRDRARPEPIVVSLRQAPGASEGEGAFICFRCDAHRDCVWARAQHHLALALGKCGVDESSLPPRRSGESLFLKLSPGGGVSMAPFPAALSVALGVGLRAAELDPADWALAPGVGPVLGRRIHRWQMARKTSGSPEKSCTLESVRGIGPIRADRIRRFLRLSSDCAGSGDPAIQGKGVEGAYSIFPSSTRAFADEGLPIKP